MAAESGRTARYRAVQLANSLVMVCFVVIIVFFRGLGFSQKKNADELNVW